jgi:hypothetical protein
MYVGLVLTLVLGERVAVVVVAVVVVAVNFVVSVVVVLVVVFVIELAVEPTICFCRVFIGTAGNLLEVAIHRSVEVVL